MKATLQNDLHHCTLLFFEQCSVRENHDSLCNHDCTMGLSPTLVYLTPLLSHPG